MMLIRRYNNDNKKLIIEVKSFKFNNDIVKIITVKHQTRFRYDFGRERDYDSTCSVASNGFILQSSGQSEMFCDKFKVLLFCSDVPKYLIVRSNEWLLKCKQAIQEYNGTYEENIGNEIIK